MNYYFLGIGGIGMSALARFFHLRGDRVEGYDRTPSPLTKSLEKEGIRVHYDDAPERLPSDIDLVVYTPAVPSDLGEMQALRARGVRMEKRSQVLGELTTGKRCIAVAGSHGKTTTSTLIAHLLTLLPDGCSAFLGGISKNFGSNLHVDTNSPTVVVEADEYDRSFLQLHPHIAVITATDPDHLDIYGTHDHMLDAYAQFANQVNPEGRLLLKEGIFLHADGTPYYEQAQGTGCAASTAEQVVHPLPAAPVTTYTTHGSDADYWAAHVRASHGNLFFDLHTPTGMIADLELCGTALYNVENAVAAAAVALECGLDESQLRHGLRTFLGVARRFDYRIREERLVYIDDYAHHPAELQATIESVRFLYPDKRIVGVFQPHLYSRTRDLADSFAAVLQLLDEVVLLPIYPAREQPIQGVTSSLLLDKMTTTKKHLCTPEQALTLVPALCPDVVLTLGAGDIDRLVPRMELTLKEHLL